ncbi:FxsA family protein [Neobacillus piezotolerans]|uniref:FxsA family protein n=1 Tax=Neobacillus piezotolerans TaxID=2259171 RepID=UPI003F6E2358
MLIILVPAAEIGILLWSGKTIGVLPTVFMILFTGVMGTYLAKSQGLKVIRQAQQQMAYGQMPGEAILDGICVLAGGILLLTPGFVTDLAGLLLLIPATRKFFKYWLAAIIRRWMNKGTIRIIR